MSLRSLSQALTVGVMALVLQGSGGIFALRGQAQLAEPLRNFYQQTINTYEQQLSVLRQQGQRLQEVDLLNSAATAYQGLEQYDKAADLHHQALTLARALQERSREEAALRGLANVAIKRGDDQGIQFYQTQLALMQKTGDRVSQGIILKALGLAYMSTGQPQKVIDTYEAYLPLVRQQQNRQEEDLTLSVLAGAYGTLGDRPHSLRLLEQRLAVAKELGPPWVYHAFAGLGTTHRAWGNTTQALEIYEQWLQVTQKNQDRSYESTARQEMALAYAELNNPPKTIQLLEQALAIAKTLDNSEFDQANLLGLLSRAESLRGNYTPAIDLQQQSLSIYQALNRTSQQESSISEAQALEHLGTTLARAGRLSEAETTLKSAIRAHQVLRQQALRNLSLLPLTRDDLNIPLRESLQDVYRSLQAVLVTQNRTDAALIAAEESRARAFVDLLGTRLGADPKVQQDAQPPTLEQLRQIAQDQNSTLVQYSVLYNDSKFPRLRFGKALPQETTLLIWVIQPNGKITFRQADLSQLQRQTQFSQVEDLVADARTSIGVRGLSFSEDTTTVERAIAGVQTTQATNQRLQQLYQLLIQPIADLLPTDPTDRVTFIPQESLFLVPFPALQDQQGKYLIEKHTILTAPSIQVLALTHQQRQRLPQTAQQVLIVGNPVMPSVRPKLNAPPQQLASLPGAEKEAQAIASLFQTQPLIGAQATKSAVLQSLDRARIIHLATHGLLDEGMGFQSSLALAPTATSDGLLTAREILNLKLNAELVVLSACDTGRGRISGDGVIGLSRAWIAAGTPSVIVSLWQVPDAPTATLMTTFYQNLQKSPDKAQALRQALLTTRQQYPDPRDWAAFTLIGEAQ